jgi:hypothetical protein
MSYREPSGLVTDPESESAARDDIFRSESFGDEYESGVVSEQDFASFEVEPESEEPELLAEYEAPWAGEDSEYSDSEFETTIGQLPAEGNEFVVTASEAPAAELDREELANLPTADEGREPEAEGEAPESMEVPGTASTRARRVVLRPGDVLTIQCR